LWAVTAQRGFDRYSVRNPLHVGGVVGYIVGAFGGLGVAAILVGLVVAIVVVFDRLGNARGAERQQLKWFAYAAGVLLVILFLAPIVVWHLPGWMSFPIRIAALSAIPVAVGIAVLKHRLYDINRIINRTLVYGALTIMVVGVYVLVVGYASTLLQGGAGGNLVVSVLATGLVAVLFQPLRERLQRAVNRLMYGQRDEPYAVLSHLGRRLEKARWSPRKRSRPSWRQSPRH